MSEKQTGKRRGGCLGRLFSLILIAALAWLAGLVWYAESIPRAVLDDGAKTDAIVVLTGGSARVEKGLELLAAKRAKKLFISGVHDDVRVKEILKQSLTAPDRLACCIVLGKAAADTWGNALETREWIRKEKYRSIRLVTADYHMPRSKLEFRVAMPKIDVVTHPVFPTNVKTTRWWRYPGTAKLIISEYNKYILVLARSWITGEAPK